MNGRRLLHDGFIDVKDIEECVVKGDCKKLGIVLPAWCILKCLLASAKSDSPGLVICMFLLSMTFFSEVIDTWALFILPDHSQNYGERLYSFNFFLSENFEVR